MVLSLRVWEVNIRGWWPCGRARNGCARRRPPSRCHKVGRTVTRVQLDVLEDGQLNNVLEVAVTMSS